jgi:hypothetical protein
MKIFAVKSQQAQNYQRPQTFKGREGFNLTKRVFHEMPESLIESDCFDCFVGLKNSLINLYDSKAGSIIKKDPSGKGVLFFDPITQNYAGLFMSGEQVSHFDLGIKRAIVLKRTNGGSKTIHEGHVVDLAAAGLIV